MLSMSGLVLFIYGDPKSEKFGIFRGIDSEWFETHLKTKISKMKIFPFQMFGLGTSNFFDVREKIRFFAA